MHLFRKLHQSKKTEKYIDFLLKVTAKKGTSKIGRVSTDPVRCKKG
jgi:hypothetical protein